MLDLLIELVGYTVALGPCEVCLLRSLLRCLLALPLHSTFPVSAR